MNVALQETASAEHAISEHPIPQNLMRTRAVMCGSPGEQNEHMGWEGNKGERKKRKGTEGTIEITKKDKTNGTTESQHSRLPAWKAAETELKELTCVDCSVPTNFS